MTGDTYTSLPYPTDRHNGYVLLRDGRGNPYVTDFTREGSTLIGYCQAVMHFMRLIGTLNPFNGAHQND